MSAILIDGKAFAERLVGSVGVATEELSKTHSFKPGLAVVLVGENPASEVYVKNKVRQTNNSGMVSIEHRLPEETSEEDLLSLVKDLNEDEKIELDVELSNISDKSHLIYSMPFHCSIGWKKS